MGLWSKFLCVIYWCLHTGILYAKYVAVNLLCRRLYQNTKVTYSYYANHLVINQTSRLRTVCKAVFPKVDAVGHAMVWPVLRPYGSQSCLLYPCAWKSNVALWKKQKNAVSAWLWQHAQAEQHSFPLATAFGEGAMGQHCSWFLPLYISSLSSWEGLFKNTSFFLLIFFFLFKERKWW